MRLHHKLLLGVAAVFSITYLYAHFSGRPPYALYAELQNSEIESFTHPEESTRYVHFNQSHTGDFTSQVQDVLISHFLATASERVYVYEPLVWQPRKQEISLSAFLLGVTRDSVPVSLVHDVCPEEDTTHVSIHTDAINQVWTVAQRTLAATTARCIVVDNWSAVLETLDHDTIQNLFPDFTSYLYNHFAWSPEIQHLASRTESFLGLRSPSAPGGYPYIAVHIQRADGKFLSHCRSLAASRKGFTMWNTHPSLRVFRPPLDPDNATSVIIEHCYPPSLRILDAIQDALERVSPLVRTAYLLHDEEWNHLAIYPQIWRLEAALKQRTRIEKVVHSGMMRTKWGDGDFKVGADMEVATKADTFVGIGYSSLSSQVVALRAASGRTLDTIVLL